MDRRTFLSIVAGSPLVFGLREIMAQDPVPRPGDPVMPEWYQRALKTMKERGLPGVVLIVPKGPDISSRLGRALLSRLKDESPDVHEILTGCALICVPDGLLKVDLDSKGFPGNRLLLDAEGARVATDFVDIEKLENPEPFVESFRALLHGKDGKLLEARARKLREAAPAETLQALDDLDAEEIAVREKATESLLKNAETLQPLLVHTRLTATTEEARRRARAILEALFKQAAAGAPGYRLPYGTKLETRTHGGVPPRDPCPSCGLSVVGTEQMEFLRFLAK